MIMLIFINHKFGRSLLQEVSLAWTFISLNLLFLILAMFLMRDYQNDQLKSDLLEKLQKSHRLLEEYARNVAEFTIIEERNRIAREIHDSVGHYLTAVNLQLERASIYLDKDPDEVKQAVQAAKLASTEALKDVRTSVSMLRNEDDLFDFKNEIQKLIDGITSTYQVKYEYIGSAKNYNHSVLLVLFRSLQESITNIQKHAKASQINITFDFKKNNCILSITDNGIGFDLEKVNTQNSFGIAGVKERVELVQGEITINSTLSGTSIVIIVPADPVLKLSESGQS
jgi:signal transduction histidine kinase